MCLLLFPFNVRQRGAKSLRCLFLYTVKTFFFGGITVLKIKITNFTR